MRIEYVLIEKQDDKQQKPSKARIMAFLRNRFPDISKNTIYIQGKRKKFEIEYYITCCSATDDGSIDNIYNIILEPKHNDKGKCAELLECANSKIVELVNTDKKYHIVIASDGLSEYFCNKAFPKYQHFERQLRHLIFKVVTKAYGNMWTEATFPKELKKELKEKVRTTGNNTREEVLIEESLHEMTMSQLIDYLFHGICEIDIITELDERYPPKKLKELSTEELIELLEKARRKSVWNVFFVNDIDIDEPKAKLVVLKNNRNKIAHCKQFHSVEYNETIQYIDLFMPKIELAIENAAISDSLTTRDVLLSFSDYTVKLASISANIGQMVAPALQRMADISAQITQAFANSALKRISEIVSQFNTSPYLDAIAKAQENLLLHNLSQLYLPTSEDILTDEEETVEGDNDEQEKE